LALFALLKLCSSFSFSNEPFITTNSQRKFGKLEVELGFEDMNIFTKTKRVEGEHPLGARFRLYYGFSPNTVAGVRRPHGSSLPPRFSSSALHKGGIPCHFLTRWGYCRSLERLSSQRLNE